MKMLHNVPSNLVSAIPYVPLEEIQGVTFRSKVTANELEGNTWKQMLYGHVVGKVQGIPVAGAVGQRLHAWHPHAFQEFLDLGV